MRGRFLSVAVAVFGAFVASGDNADAQAPIASWSSDGDGVANVQGGGFSGHFGESYGGSYGAMPQRNYGPTPITPGYNPGVAANTWYDDLSGDKGGTYKESPLDEFLKDMAKESYFRLEYMNWSFKKPGSELLGSATNASLNPNSFFDVTVAGQFFGEARVAGTQAIELQHINGVRGTLGIPLLVGTIEASIFSLETDIGHSDEGRLGAPAAGNLVGVPQFIGTTTLTDGVVGTNIFLYDDSFRTAFKSSVWGTEANYLFEPNDPNPGIQIRPMVGFRFLGQNEQFTQVGVFDGQDDPTVTPVRTVIRSAASNDIYASQAGLRIEYVSRWLTIGLEPKLGFGVNDYDTELDVSRLRSNGDPRVISTASGSRLSTVGELGVYSRLHVTTNLSLTVGYTFLFADNVVRPHSGIYYNDIPPNTAPTALRTRPNFELMYYQGINVGGELRF